MKPSVTPPTARETGWLPEYVFTGDKAPFAGAILVILTADIGSIEDLLLPFTAGAFVYIAGTDLIPELHKEPEVKRSFVQLMGLLAGIGVMLALVTLE